MRSSIYKRTGTEIQQQPQRATIDNNVEYPNSNIRQFLNMKRITKDKGCLILFLLYGLALVVMMGIGFFYGNYNDLGNFVNGNVNATEQQICRNTTKFVTSDMMSCTSECGPGDVTYLGRVCMSSVNGTFDFPSEVQGLISMYNIKYTFPMIIYVSAALLGVTSVLFCLLIYVPKLIYLFISALFFMLLGMAFYLLKNVQLRLTKYNLSSASIIYTSEQNTRSISFVLLGLYLLIFPFVLFSPKKIQLGTLLIQKLRQFYKSMGSMIAFSFFCICVIWGSLIAEIFLIMNFYTAGTINKDPVFSMFHTYEAINLSHPASLTFHFIGVFWVYSTFISWHRYFVSSALCLWYFQESQSLFPVKRGLKRSLHHVGSAAMDGILMPIQWVFLLIYAVVKTNDQNDQQKAQEEYSCITSCLNSFRRFFTDLYRSVNRDAPSSGVFTNCTYFESCQNANQILSTKSHRFFNIGGTLTIFLSLFVSILWIIIMYFIVFYTVLDKPFPPVITSVVLPVFCVFIIGLVVGCLFANIFTSSVDCLLYCYLVERKSLAEGAELQRTEQQLKIKKTLDQCYCRASDDLKTSIFIYEQVDENTLDLTYVSKKQ